MLWPFMSCRFSIHLVHEVRSGVLVSGHHGMRRYPVPSCFFPHLQPQSPPMVVVVVPRYVVCCVYTGRPMLHCLALDTTASSALQRRGRVSRGGIRSRSSPGPSIWQRESFGDGCHKIRVQICVQQISTCWHAHVAHRCCMYSIANRRVWRGASIFDGNDFCDSLPGFPPAQINC